MATYRSQLITVPSPEPQGYAASLRVTERPVYGSSRLGTYARWEELYDHPVVSTPAPDPVQPVDLNYELTDHLGNVTAVVTGRLLNGNGGGTPKQAELVSAQGYEAFGSLLPGRNYSSSNYRWGFNGAEKDDEVHGSTGTSYAFEHRMHDPRVGRWLSLDPLATKYPELSPYAAMGNSPIQYADRDGRVIVDPKSEKPVVRVDGQWKTITGTNKDGTPKYGEVSKQFVDVTQPVLDRLTSREVGTRIYDELQRISTVVVIDPTDEYNVEGSSLRPGGSNSEWYSEPDGEVNGDGLYKRVVISPFMETIDRNAQASGVDPDEKFFQVMSVEAGHISTPGQVSKELSYGLVFDTPEKYADVYNDLLNNAIKVGKDYRKEVGKPVDASSNTPITYQQGTELGKKLTLKE